MEEKTKVIWKCPKCWKLYYPRLFRDYHDHLVGHTDACNEGTCTFQPARMGRELPDYIRVGLYCQNCGKFAGHCKCELEVDETPPPRLLYGVECPDEALLPPQENPPRNP